MKKPGTNEADSGPSSDAASGWGRFITWRWIALLLLAPLAFGPAPAAAQNQCETADCLAGGLLKHIPTGEKIALVPLMPPYSNIPKVEADILYDTINVALANKSKGRHKFVARALHEELWELYRSEREKSLYQDFWMEKRVGVIILCKDRGLWARGVVIFCTASGVGKDSKLKSDEFSPPTQLPITRQVPFFHYRYSIRKLGLDLASKMVKSGIISRVFIAGEPTELRRDVGKLLKSIVGGRLRSRRGSLHKQDGMKTEFGRDDKAATPSELKYELRGEVKWKEYEDATLMVRLVNADNREILRQGEGHLKRSWVPKYLLKKTIGRFKATARAVESERLDPQSAKLAVKNLARAMVVSKALGTPDPAIEAIDTEAQGMQALRHALKYGVPNGERFEGPMRDGRDGWRAELSARVVRVGAVSKPSFRARLSKYRLRAKEPIRIELSTKAKKTLHVAVFAWGAEGKVVRLYPHVRVKDPRISANERLSLPLRDKKKDCVLSSAPREGKSASHAAVIVVAAYERFRFDDLMHVPPLCFVTKKQPDPSNITADTFLSVLAELDLSHAGIVVLPYRVAR